MRQQNLVELRGYVGKAPERRVVGNSVVTSFTVATNESWKNSAGEWKTSTEWHNIAVWGRLAELANNVVRAGDPIHITGSIRTRSWVTDGVKRYRTEIVASELATPYIIPRENASEGDSAPPDEAYQGAVSDADDSIPY